MTGQIRLRPKLSKRSLDAYKTHNKNKEELAMFNVLILLSVGILIGYLTRNVGFLKHIDKSISATVLVMLFVFGLTIGSDTQLLSNIGRFGAQAVVLALAGVTGSLVMSYLVYWLMFRKKKGGKK